LPRDFWFHDLRQYRASVLIVSGADVRGVRARLRQASANPTLDIYDHLWPDSSESTRAAIDAVRPNVRSRCWADAADSR
jgi:hypothetical protein